MTDAFNTDAVAVRWRERLTRDAQAHGPLDVAYRTIDSQVGPLLLAATDAGVVRVAYQSQDFDTVLQSLAEMVSPRVLHAPARLDEAARWIEDSFAGRRSDARVRVDLTRVSPFRRRVIERVREVPPGSVTTYGTVAAAVGNPRAARAVGSACATNPVPILIPCHRVVPATGGTGQYVGGPDTKAYLLARERDTGTRP